MLCIKIVSAKKKTESQMIMLLSYKLMSMLKTVKPSQIHI